MWESLVRFSKHPIFNILSFILGLIVSVVLYKLSIQAPALTYYVHPVRTSVVKAGELSEIQIVYRKNEVRGDVSAAQIAFWNNGKKPVMNADVLSPFQILVGKGVEIIEAKIRKTSRDVIALQLDKASENIGVIGLSWRILERGDGGIIQIIYKGRTDVPIKLVGTVIGQRAPVESAYIGSLKSPEELYESRKRENSRFGWICIGTAIILLFLLIFFYYREKEPFSSSEVILCIVAFIFAFVILLDGMWHIFFQPLTPPFGF